MKYIIASLFLFIGFLPAIASAQTDYEFQAEIVSIEEERVDGELKHVIFNAVDESGETVRVNSDDTYAEGVAMRLNEGRDVLLRRVSFEGGDRVFFVDVVRTPAMLLITLLFALVVILVGAWRGVRGLLGLVVTVGILFGMILPLILAGNSPVLVTILGSLLILAINMPLSHGLNRRTWVALGSCVIGLFFAWILSVFFVWFANLSGLGSEEIFFVIADTGGAVSAKGLLLAGMILGAVGVLDDIAITQSEAVAELIEADPKMKKRDLFASSMRIGRHHISSVTNTLVLAYAGVALPLFLLFMIGQEIDLWRFINEELVAEEIIRTLAGTLALVLLVPISTILAVLVQGQRTK
ncbi:YibE/F family protein [Candidatus Uhrbacteria bacterium]|jgi:uncharacterized membrane protein|nr:YibE/F family protein [Candidatus Uhrbacteria bacterium]